SMSSSSLTTDVLIAGAGPVGLVLAMELAARNIKVVVVEPRARREPPSVQCNHVSARSMESFRRLGVAAEGRQSGLPEDRRPDIAYCATGAGSGVAGMHMPVSRDRSTDATAAVAHWPAAEPPHRMNQIYLDPILYLQAENHPGITLINRTRLEAFQQVNGGV